MRKILFLIAALAVFSIATNVDAQSVVVDFSPDATGDIAGIQYINYLDFSQNIGESFTLLTTTSITGGSMFGTTGGSGFAGVGELMEFGIFADDGFGAPGALVVNEIVAVDAYDGTGTSIDPTLSRYHTTLASSVLLGPGNYYFTLTGAVGSGPADPFAAAGFGGWGDGGVWAGFDTNINLEAGFFAGTGDAFFQIEGKAIPEPASAGLIGVALLGMVYRRRRA